MILTNLWERGSGKTTVVRSMMKSNNDLVLIVPHEGMKRDAYPKELHSRIMTAQQYLNDTYRMRSPKKVILDEGFLYDKDVMAKIYYKLGCNNTEVIVYGS